MWHLTCVLAVVSQLEVRYSVTDLGVLAGHQSSRAFSVNNDREIVGESTEDFLFQHAFVWSPKAEMSRIHVFAGGPSVALTISDSKCIAGIYSDENSVTRGWVMKEGKIADVGTLGGPFCAPASVNDAGVVVGVSFDMSYKNHAFVWAEGGMVSILPNFSFSVATGVNARGDVTGFFQYEEVGEFSDTVAFVRAASGALTFLPTLGGAHSCAQSINDHGQVVGLSWLTNGHYHAFLWDQGVMTDLGVLGEDSTSEAVALNNRGEVIGRSSSLFSEPRAFVYTKARGMKDLQTLILTPNFVLEYASDINDHGDIVGWGFFEDDMFCRAVLLTPVLCPRSFPMLSTGFSPERCFEP